MKNILVATFLLSAILVSASAVTVTIDDAGNCFVDGQNYGKPADAIANNRQIAPEIQRALDAWLLRVRENATTQIVAASAKADAAETARADAEKRLGDVVQALQIVDPEAVPLPLVVVAAVRDARQSAEQKEQAELEKVAAEVSAKLAARAAKKAKK